MIITETTTPLVPNSVMELAESLGYYRDAGVELELVRVQQTPSAVAALHSGSGEMANISVDTVLQLVARGQLPLKAVVSPNKSIPYVIVAKEGIASVADLVGKSFGVGRIGSLDHSLSTMVLRQHGLDPAGLDFVNIGQPNVRAQALLAGQIDATTVSIGTWVSLPDKQGLKLLVGQEEFYAAAPVVNKVNVVTPEVLAARRPEVVAVVRAIVLASRDFAREPERWVEAMAAARPDVAVEELRRLAQAYRGSWSVNGGLNPAELDHTVDWNYASDELKDLPRIDAADWVDHSVIAEVLQEIGTVPDVDQPAS
ncbi:MAG TPA: ABC transporter substrate-binding protein [Geminicoccaceae bacterium]|nr:ABC transporter substrate-binding protein [Geminicoccaceae bacterium]